MKLYLNKRININKILQIFLIIINFINYAQDVESFTFESKYRHSLVLENGNLLIVHKTGINLYNRLLSSLIGQYNFSDNLTEKSSIGTNFFQEEETDNKYVFILAKNILYIFSPDNLEFIFSSDLSEDLLNLDNHVCMINFNFFLYQYIEPIFYIFVSYPLEGKAILKLFKVNLSTNSVSNYISYTHSSIDSDSSERYISKLGISCQLMNGNILVCFYKINYPKELRAVGFQLDEYNNTFQELSEISASSSQIEKEQQTIKSCISEDKQKAFICYRVASYEGDSTYCVVFDITTLTFGEEVSYAEKCSTDSPEYINIYYFKENREYFFICKTTDNNENYKIIKFDNNFNKIDLDEDEYNQEPNLSLGECYHVYSFSLIYLSKYGSYHIISDPLVYGTTELIKINTLPDYYNYNTDSTSTLEKLMSSLPYIYSTNINKIKTTTIISSSLSSTNIFSSLLISSTAISSKISSNKISTLYPITSTNLFSNILSSKIYSSNIYSSRIPFSTIISSKIKTSPIPFSTIISSKIKTSTIPFSTIISSKIKTSTISSSTIISSKIKTSLIYSSNIYSSTIISSSNISYSDINSSSNIFKTIPFILNSTFLTIISDIINNTILTDCDLISKGNKILNNICIKNFTRNLIDQIKKEKSIISKEFNDYAIYLYELGTNIEEVQINNINLIFVDNLDLKNNLMQNYGLEKGENIYVLILDYINLDLNSAVNGYDFIFVLENGTILNLTELDIDIYSNISLPIKNFEISNYDYALYFSGYGYDIYDNNDSFYKNICTSAYYDDNDIVINDRKKYIYPNNISLCIYNCVYKIADLEKKRFICECILNSKNASNSSNSYSFEIEEKNTFSTYLLDLMNYKLFNCYFLLLSFNNYKENIAFYLLLIYFFLYIFFILKFFIHRIRYLRIHTFENLAKNFKKIIKKRISKKKTTCKSLNLNNKEKSSDEQSNQNLILRNSKVFNIKRKKIKRNTSRKLSKKKTTIRNNKQNELEVIENEENEKNKVNKINNKENEINKIDNRKDEEIIYSKLCFNEAILLDKRNTFQIFIQILLEKIEIIDLIFNNNTRIKELFISKYILSLLIDFFFNAFLYSDKVISKKYKNKGKLNIVIRFTLSILSNIITNIICYFLNYCNDIEDKIEEMLEIRQEIKLLKILKIFTRYIIIKIIILSLFQIVIILMCIYYILIFFIVYSCSQISLLINYLTSLLEKIGFSLLISFIIAVSRKLSIFWYSKYLYNTSKYIDEHL